MEGNLSRPDVKNNLEMGCILGKPPAVDQAVVQRQQEVTETPHEDDEVVARTLANDEAIARTMVSWGNRFGWVAEEEEVIALPNDKPETPRRHQAQAPSEEELARLCRVSSNPFGRTEDDDRQLLSRVRLTEYQEDRLAALEAAHEQAESRGEQVAGDCAPSWTTQSPE